MYMRVYVCWVCRHVSVCVRMSACMHVSLYVCMSLCMSVCMPVYMFAGVCVCDMYIYIYIQTGFYVRSVRTYVCMYVRTCTSVCE